MLKNLRLKLQLFNNTHNIYLSYYQWACLEAMLTPVSNRETRLPWFLLWQLPLKGGHLVTTLAEVDLYIHVHVCVLTWGGIMMMELVCIRFKYMTRHTLKWGNKTFNHLFKKKPREEKVQSFKWQIFKQNMWQHHKICHY